MKSIWNSIKAIAKFIIGMFRSPFLIMTAGMYIWAMYFAPAFAIVFAIMFFMFLALHCFGYFCAVARYNGWA
jgi:hypothetical protein